MFLPLGWPLLLLLLLSSAVMLDGPGGWLNYSTSSASSCACAWLLLLFLSCRKIFDGPTWGGLNDSISSTSFVFGHHSRRKRFINLTFITHTAAAVDLVVQDDCVLVSRGWESRTLAIRLYVPLVVRSELRIVLHRRETAATINALRWPLHPAYVPALLRSAPFCWHVVTNL